MPEPRLSRWLFCAILPAFAMFIPACAHNPTSLDRALSLNELPLPPGQIPRFNDNILRSTVILFADKNPNKTSEMTSVVGCGALISDDGYILTVAHCLQNSPDISAALYNPSTQSRQILPDLRVVWKGNPYNPHTDIAILKTSAHCEKPFEFADRSLLATNDPVAGAGMSVRSNNHTTPYAGKILLPSVSTATLDGHTFQNIAVMVPCGPGDSGGPLVDSNGRLIGPIRSLNFFLSNKFLDLNKSYNAIAPDPQWINQIIQQDRQARAQTAQASLSAQ